jgi:glycosyltransferase involved in cell wall biosynthesis
MTTRPTKSKLRIGLVAPHIFLHRDILPQVIFSPGHLVIDLANGLHALGADVTLFSPGPVEVAARNVTADLSLFEQELAGRGDTYVDLLKKHPFTFVTLARQVQSEMIAKAYAAANAGELDVVHIYTNEEDTALPFAALCRKPVVFTHHDPFNFLVKYKNVFPKYAHLNWVSMSFAQRTGMPADTRWAANIYHGVAEERFTPLSNPSGNYIAYLGRIIQPKGLHLAIAAAKKAGVALKIAGKHYAGQKDSYWREVIEPQLGETIEYVGFLKDDVSRQQFLGNASALVVPSLFDEPFGMVAIEALACGTPLIGVANGALPEIIRDGNNGLLVQKTDETSMIADMAQAMRDAGRMSRQAARASFEENFTLARMCNEHFQLYQRLAQEV